MLRLTVCIVTLLFGGASYAKENQSHQSRKAGEPERQQILPSFPAFGGGIGPSIVFIERPSVPEEEINKSAWNSKECPEAKSHDEADLCEQRRMAKAADDSVSLNKVQVGLGIAGFIALLITIGLTYRATSAAIESNKIAHDNAKRELRAYVFATRAILEFTSTGVKATIRIENSGQTPAKNFESFARIFVSILPFEPSYIREPAGKLGRFTSSLHPNGNVGMIVEDKNVRRDWFEHAKSGVLPTFVHGMIWYDDVFDENHMTKFRFVWRGGETNPPGVMMTAEAGNEAT